MEFFLSPGFGGLAAVVAAAIAYAAARWRGRVDKLLGDNSAWWDRARWALDQTREDDRYAQLLGWNIVATLAETAPTEQDAEILRQAAEAAEEAYTEPLDDEGADREETDGDG